MPWRIHWFRFSKLLRLCYWNKESEWAPSLSMGKYCSYLKKGRFNWPQNSFQSRMNFVQNMHTFIQNKQYKIKTQFQKNRHYGGEKKKKAAVHTFERTKNKVISTLDSGSDGFNSHWTEILKTTKTLMKLGMGSLLQTKQTW